MIKVGITEIDIGYEDKEYARSTVLRSCRRHMRMALSSWCFLR